MLIASLAVIAGFAFLAWGADRFVEGSSGIARCLGVSPLIIGLTIVGFGTSAPELLVSGIAAWDGRAALAVGNAIGSNITNISLVLGITALVQPLVVGSGILRRELPVLLLIMVFALGLVFDGFLSRTDGLILVLGLFAMIAWIVWLGVQGRGSHDAIEDEFAEEIEETPSISLGKAGLLALGGLVLMFVSSRVLVWGAVEIATYFGMSELVIGLTVIALGTSLPELAASVVSAMKNEHDIALGNVIGSNMFNLLGVMALPGLISPGPLADGILSRDYPVMLALTVALILMAYGLHGKGRVTRLEGGFLVMTYIAYMYWLYLTSGTGGS
ncbi:MAG: calcium/sodium antiporter [Gammaproteobacteria bacterium]|nr:calcium/sodium antiporter [Gammaproteobacteria bacterium]